MLAAGRIKKIEKKRGEKIAAKHERIRKAGVVDLLGDHMPIKRQPALLVLGEKMPVHLQVTFKGKEHHASVNPDGTIAVEGHGQTYNSPSRAGKAVAGREVDGWTFWSYLKPNGDLEKINELRKAVA